LGHISFVLYADTYFVFVSETRTVSANTGPVLDAHGYSEVTL